MTRPGTLNLPAFLTSSVPTLARVSKICEISDFFMPCSAAILAAISDFESSRIMSRGQSGLG
eukprot:CAMPEP_0197655964 /NCGR_PEP_ID=MMETSP1338-20131121/39785_1 /TAXON_ID=43686 ORGANISM="Pelagodinium beii, Strain RCC1491" /NCGR_SAMPLE_ID=MMETSP1338 /ASSEMBLY_ACC=CAM_ASM_000754 /LENGTH=61 /DNA_ID=CAMNT_0043231731 /DNA_START=191 /DNA_END=376 /DNA_ORIENTATION=-